MGFSRKIQYFLVHTLKYSNKEAKDLILKGAVCVNDVQVAENILLHSTDEIRVNNQIVKAHQHYVYFAYHKPIGLVSSLNANVEFSLYEAFKQYFPLFIAGRLDKYSHGLLLLSNNGKWVQNIIDPNQIKEKEYIVKVNTPYSNNFISLLENGVDIGFYTTKPCKCSKINNDTFKIILTEGKNKQIKRMCKALGYSVTELKRIRIDDFELGNMLPGEIKLLKL